MSAYINELQSQFKVLGIMGGFSISGAIAPFLNPIEGGNRGPDITRAKIRGYLKKNLEGGAGRDLPHSQFLDPLLFRMRPKFYGTKLWELRYTQWREDSSVVCILRITVYNSESGQQVIQCDVWLSINHWICLWRQLYDDDRGAEWAWQTAQKTHQKKVSFCIADAYIEWISEF